MAAIASSVTIEGSSVIADPISTPVTTVPNSDPVVALPNNQPTAEQIKENLLLMQSVSTLVSNTMNQINSAPVKQTKSKKQLAYMTGAVVLTTSLLILLATSFNVELAIVLLAAQIALLILR